MENDTDDWDLPPSKPVWICQSCGHKDTTKPMPRDRAKFYADSKPATCPRCKSKDMMPSGF